MKVYDFNNRHALGTNQYQIKRRRKGFSSTYWTLLALPLVFSLCLGVKPLVHEAATPAHASVLISPLPKITPTPEFHITWHYIDEPKPTPTLAPETEQIRAYIKEVFQDDADKAFQLLACENSSLNPDMVNTYGNTPEGSRDIGVFSINEFWQGVQGKFLFNWKVNVLIAKQLFDENGGSFKLWACSKKVGLE